MRSANFILAVMFMIFAFLQVNDPDPVIWILIYGSMALLAILAMFRIYPRVVIIALIVMFGIYSLGFLDGVSEWWTQDDLGVIFDDLAKMEHPFIEESREFLGLLICEAVLFFYLFMSRRT